MYLYFVFVVDVYFDVGVVLVDLVGFLFVGLVDVGVIVVFGYFVDFEYIQVQVVILEQQCFGYWCCVVECVVYCVQVQFGEYFVIDDVVEDWQFQQVVEFLCWYF